MLACYCHARSSLSWCDAGSVAKRLFDGREGLSGAAPQLRICLTGSYPKPRWAAAVVPHGNTVTRKITNSLGCVSGPFFSQPRGATQRKYWSKEMSSIDAPLFVCTLPTLENSRTAPTCGEHRPGGCCTAMT